MDKLQKAAQKYLNYLKFMAYTNVAGPKWRVFEDSSISDLPSCHVLGLPAKSSLLRVKRETSDVFYDLGGDFICET